ncbi:hypothetical protein JL720_9775 [Aureococcus anophagefferens]|nr:hypothetical protein JL720_9775 [Aureococcus anophagefferens]
MSQQRAHAGNHEANPYEEIHEVDEETGEIFVSIKRRPSPSPSSHAAMAYELDGEDAVDFAGMMNALGVEVDEAAADAEAWPAEAADDEVKADDPELEEARAVARADGADPPAPPPDPELEEALAAVQSLERAALARSSSAEHKRADAEFAAALSASEDAVVAKALACEDEDGAERGARTRAEVDLSGDADLAFALDLQEAAAEDDGDFALRLAAEERDATVAAAGATRRRRGAGASRRSSAAATRRSRGASPRRRTRARGPRRAPSRRPPRRGATPRRAGRRSRWRWTSAALDDAAIRAALRPHRGRPAADAADEAFARSLAAAEEPEPAPAVDPSLNRRERRAMDKRPWAVPEAELDAQESASQQIKAQRGRQRGAALGARGDPAYRQAKALRDRMYRQRDVAAALFFAANNGALLGPDAAVHRCSEIGFEGVVDVAVAACGTHFGVGHDVLIDLHWLSARDATFVVDAALDELETTVNRRKASLKFIAGRGRHSVGAPKLGAAVRACLEKRPRLKAAECRELSWC